MIVHRRVRLRYEDVSELLLALLLLDWLVDGLLPIFYNKMHALRHLDGSSW